ncbi:V-type ATP synthase subunit I [Cotonvirus japonicus]|uniref:V-type ATP synthase subunit I n=1 Tax=Cotonvirus japonicus TaxID=2811091 RepID=A0ABM7NSM5_9VIRU|nr:V-type ATP synthase subunit I [Cotonvirus japonicus]BCS83170.1 V-type ATP synthase subunit I [Cotonvirus japonicus]
MSNSEINNILCKLHDESCNRSNDFNELSHRIDDVDYILSNIKSQTTGVLENLNKNIKKYEIDVKELKNEHQVDTLTYKLLNDRCLARIDILDHEIKSMKNDNILLFDKLKEITNNNTKLFETILDMIKDINLSNPSK